MFSEKWRTGEHHKGKPVEPQGFCPVLQWEQREHKRIAELKGAHMTAKEYLQRISAIEAEKSINTSEIERLSESGINSESIIREISENILRLERERQEIISTIKKLDIDGLSVLYGRYACNVSLKEIAYSMNRSLSWVNEKHREAIKELQTILDATN